ARRPGKMRKRSRIKDFLWRHAAGIAFTVMIVFVIFIGFVGYTYVVITKKFDSSRRWDLPSRVYSDATPLVPGMTIPRALLEPKVITSIFNDEMEDRLPISISAVPRVVTDAIIASEDKNFYKHAGISIRGTAGALVTDIKQGKFSHGGSTLTQQLVKNYYLNQ